MRSHAVVLFAVALAGCLAESSSNAELFSTPQVPSSDPCTGESSGPCAFPRFDMSGVELAGTFSIPGTDSRGTMINYGGSAVGVSEDGKSLYVSCRQTATGQPARGLVAKLAIPEPGARADEIAPCEGLTMAALGRIHPDPNAYQPFLGGILEIGGRLLVDAYISYDADGGTVRSHWSGTSLTRLQGPFSGTVKPGLVKSYMGRVPREWQSMLGGDAYVTAGYMSIISRSSYGAAFTVFTAADVTRDDFPMTMLLGCPHSEESCITWNTPQSLWIYNGSEQSGGGFIVSGTRTFIAIEREADGPTCYGYATRNLADHGTPFMDAVYCYSLSDPFMQKAPMGYPYRLVAKLYDLHDFVEVKNGNMAPWDVKPYDVVTLPGSQPGESLGYTGGGAYNPVTGEYYLTRELYPMPGDSADVTVYRGFSPPPGWSPPASTASRGRRD